MKQFEYIHTVSFEETNLVGNVYFANYVKWQGVCRERFLKEHVHDVLEDMKNGLALITLNCSCNYLSELRAFDEVRICMYLERIQQNRISMSFEYYKIGETENDILVAKGKHEIGCFRRQESGLIPVEVPQKFKSKLELYV